MDTITNIIHIDTVEEYIEKMKEAKEHNTEIFFDMSLELLNEIMLGDALDKIYNPT